MCSCHVIAQEARFSSILLSSSGSFSVSLLGCGICLRRRSVISSVALGHTEALRYAHGEIIPLEFTNYNDY